MCELVTSIVNFSFNSEPAKQILATQCPAYVSSSEQQVEEGEYELVKGFKSISYLSDTVFYFIFVIFVCYLVIFVCLFVCFFVCLFVCLYQ